MAKLYKDKNGHQVFIYCGPEGGGVPGIASQITREAAEADGDRAASQLEAAINNKTFRKMTVDDLPKEEPPADDPPADDPPAAGESEVN
jgi:hypothetical protein